MSNEKLCQALAYTLFCIVIGTVQGYYEAAVGVVSDTINDWLESMDVEFQLEFLDECVATVDIVEMIKNPQQTGMHCVYDNFNNKCYLPLLVLICFPILSFGFILHLWYQKKRGRTCPLL